MMGEHSITVYVLKETDGLTREERLVRAARHYCGPVDRTLLKVEKTPLGKPYFPCMPQVHFSISHSGEYWVCAFSEAEIGVDLQEHAMLGRESKEEATLRFAKMAKRFFHPKEAKYVEAESFYRFFGVWAARESYVKYTGQGIDATFSEHCVVPENEEQFSALAGWKAQGCWFWEVVFEENYTLCVCAAKESPCSVVTEI